MPVLEIGQSAECQRVFSAIDVRCYSQLGGHEPAAGQVPEPLIGALFSYLLGVELPGLGTNYLKQEYKFLRSANVGEMLSARVTVTRIREDKQLVDLETVCHNADGSIVCEGCALVFIGDIKPN